MLGNGYIDFALLKQATTLLSSRGGFNLPLHYGHSHLAGYAVVQQNTRRKFVEDTGRLISHDPTLATQEIQMPDYETVLVWVFWRSVATFATDPRDDVYGIIGVTDTIMKRLAQTMGCHNESRKNNIVSHCAPAYTPIKPDYSVDTARVFREFIARLMHSSLGIRARGRSVSSVTLDSQLVKDARTAGNIHSRQEGGINLLSLGPATLKGGDEAWALHGSK